MALFWIVRHLKSPLRKVLWDKQQFSKQYLIDTGILWKPFCHDEAPVTYSSTPEISANWISCLHDKGIFGRSGLCFICCVISASKHLIMLHLSESATCASAGRSVCLLAVNTQLGKLFLHQGTTLRENNFLRRIEL